MGGRLWFWLLWASGQFGGRIGRVVGVARAARSALLFKPPPHTPQPRSVYVRPVRPNERSGLSPRHSANRRKDD